MSDCFNDKTYMLSINKHLYINVYSKDTFQKIIVKSTPSIYNITIADLGNTVIILCLLWCKKVERSHIRCVHTCIVEIVYKSATLYYCLPSFFKYPAL